MAPCYAFIILMVEKECIQVIEPGRGPGEKLGILFETFNLKITMKLWLAIKKKVSILSKHLNR